MQVSTVNATTYALVNVTPSTQSLGSAIAAPTAYARSGSSPLGASFNVAPATYAVSTAFGTVIKSPEIVDAANAIDLSMTTLPDGRVLIGYQDSSLNVKVAVYSVTGVLTQTLTIASGTGYGTLQIYSKVCISALTSGKFVISYPTGATTAAVKLYSSTFTQIGSTVSITGLSAVNLGYFPVVSGITNDRYVIVYPITSNNPNYAIYDNTNTLLTGPTSISGSDFKNLTVCGFSNGGFLVSGRITTGAQQTAMYSNPSGNTFTQTVAMATMGITTTPQNARAVANTNGVVFVPYGVASTDVQAYCAALSTSASAGGMQPIISSLPTQDNTAVGVTGSGVPVLAGVISGTIRLNNIVDSQLTLSTAFAPFISSAHSQICMTPSYAGNVGLAYIDTSQKINYSIVCVSAIPLNTAVTSTDSSTPVPIYPTTTSVSPAIQNTIFAGVALQTVPAGGAGLVQVSGPAQLNSNYPAGTTYRAFDHQSQGVPGVKGTITGRAITLQGNT
jgi:hypothetical protein